ncbi:MAG: hypothetical protein AAF690_19950 [Acidobacteriota bacterium]
MPEEVLAVVDSPPAEVSKRMKRALQSHIEACKLVSEKLKKRVAASDFSENEHLLAASELVDRGFASRFENIADYEEALSNASLLLSRRALTGQSETRQSNEVAARTCFHRGNLLRLKCRLDDAWDSLEEGEARARSGVGTPKTMIEGVRLRADLLADSYQPVEALEEQARCVEIATASSLKELKNGCEVDYVSQRYFGPTSQETEEEMLTGVQKLRQLLESPETTKYYRAVAAANIGAGLSSLGRPFSEIDRALLQADQISEGAPVLRISLIRIRGLALGSRGRSEEALSLISEAAQRSATIGHPRLFVKSMLDVADILVEGQAWSQAAPVALQGAKLASSLKLPRAFAEAAEMFAEAVAAGNLGAEAQSQLRSLISTSARTK